MKILGISAFYHDSAAALIIDGNIEAAVEEERFSRDKHDSSFPENAVEYCLEYKDLETEDLDKVVFYEKPIQKFDRILKTAAIEFPRGYKLFSEALPEWLGKKLRARKKIRQNIGFEGDIEFVEHHRSHAASAYYPSPFEKAAVLTIDGVGEWKTNQMFLGKSGQLDAIKHMEFPNSLGLLYSTITAFLGFMVNNDEYKVMGLASYGEPKYRDEFENFIQINEDGSYKLNKKYFAFTYQKKMWSRKMENLLGEPRDREKEDIRQRHKDIAATLQEITEDIILKQINHLYDITETKNICMAGGVALNSVANGKIRKNMPFENIWVQPAAGDDGGAMGAAMDRAENKNFNIKNAYLGPSYNKERVREVLNENNAEYRSLSREKLLESASERLADGEIMGLYKGRLEWGPRALGNRSILADPRKEEMRDKINRKVKFREKFRPFAPTVLQEHASDYFDIEGESPYMLFVFDTKEYKKDNLSATTHVDGTSRVQTLEREQNPFYYDLIEKFYQKTGVPVLLNTSFNLKGMPIVNTPEQAYDKCFKQSDIDCILTRNFIIEN